MKVGMFLAKAPIEPAQLIILAIRVVIATLRPPGFISHQQHRVPTESRLSVRALRTWRARRRSTSGSSREAFHSAVPRVVF